MKNKFTYSDFVNALTSLSGLALIAANLIPLAGVLLFDWSIIEIMLLYWAESAIIGVYNLVKMVIIGGWKSLSLGVFFIVHYGGFMAGHLLFIYVLFGKDKMPGHSFSEFLSTLEIMYLLPALLALLVSHGISFIFNYLGRREYQGRSLKQQMQEPYQRIIIMHVTIIIGGFLATELNSPLPALVFLVLLKIVVDIRGHLQERRIAAS